MIELPEAVVSMMEHEYSVVRITLVVLVILLAVYTTYYAVWRENSDE